MPTRWLAIGYNAAGEQIFRKSGLPVAEGLRTGPDPAAATWEVSGGGLSVDEGLAWMVDYDRAVQVGMAITVALSGSAAPALDGVESLLVLGVQEKYDALSASDEFAKLLDIHERTTGLAFVPQGTPTNNTESVSSGWTSDESDGAELARLAERQIITIPQGPKLNFDDNASHLASALGMADSSSLRRLEHGFDREAAKSGYMRTVLFEAVMGTLLRQLLDVGAVHGITVKTVNAIRTWFVQQVTGGAAYPTVRIGSQPYGILPVRRTVTTPDLTTTAGRVEQVVGLLIDVWRQSAELVPALDSNQTDTSGEGVLESTIASILATQPHPARLFLRKLEEFIDGTTAFAVQYTYDFLIDTIDSGHSGGQLYAGDHRSRAGLSFPARQ